MESAPGDYAIRIQGLKKKFGDTLAVNDLSFEIPAGVIAGFVGPNGSGKTTTMRVLATLLKQDSGSARVFGYETRVPSDARKVRHAIGFMPDYFGLYTDMTAAEYLDFFGAAYRIPAAQRDGLVSDILALVNLTEKRDTLIAGLSRGMQQKLSLGRTLVHSPDLLLLDEPASGLDPRARIELMELLRELKNMGKTIFISSHILSELHNLCDMVVIIEKGEVRFVGGIDEASAGVMEGKNFVELVIGSDPDAAVQGLKSLEGVQGIRQSEKVLLMELSDSVSSTQIIEFCVKQGIQLEEVKRGSANLEEIFMHLTGNSE